MALDSYANLQTAILGWLARPGDTLVQPAVPDMIRLFEREATRRLKVAGAEKRASLTAVSSAVLLPADFGELRLATSGGVNLTYVPPHQLPGGGGAPAHYTIIGNELHLGPGPDQTPCTIEIIYQSGVPPLSDSNPSNWLLDQHPDCYLFGALTEAESYIGHDERVPLWAQRREATFASIEQHDRKQRWNGTPLSIRAEGVNYSGGGSAAGDWAGAVPLPIPITSVVAGPGLIGGGASGPVTLALDSPVAINDGGTDASTASQALANLGGAPLASPVFTGDPKAPTPSPGDNDTSIATTGFVQAALAALPPSGSSITTNDTPPLSPADGDAWFDSVGGQLYIFFIDAGGPPGQWVPASNMPGPQGPTGATGAPGTNGANANITGLTTGQIGIAGSATSITSSIPTTTFVARAGDTMTGALTINSTLAVGGNANPTLEAISGFTRLHATDTTGVNGGIFLGDTANGKIALHRRTTHNFQDDAATVTFAIFDAASTRNVSGAWATISSASLKEQIEPYRRGLEAILELNPVQFRYQAGTPFAEVDKPSRQLFGLIAEEVAPHVPEIVGKTTTEIRGVDTEINTLESGNLIYALINAVKELSAKVQALEAKP